MGKFKVGDRVRGVRDYMGRGGGCIGTVKAGAEEVLVKFDAPFKGHGEDGLCWNLPEYYLALVPSFNVGDRVRLTPDNDGYGRRGAEGLVITAPTSTDGEYEIRFDEKFRGSNDWWAAGEDLELVPTVRFKIGARVVTTGQLHGAVAIGSKGTIKDTSIFDNNYYVRFDDGQAWFAKPEVLAAAPTSKFKAGDKVRYKRDHTIKYVVAGPKTAYGDGTPYHGPAAVDYAGTYNGWDREDTLELDEPTTPHIVAAVTDGQPQPSTRPFIHHTLDSASREADRLATKHPGQEFAVYARVAGKIADVTVHEAA